MAFSVDLPGEAPLTDRHTQARQLRRDWRLVVSGAVLAIVVLVPLGGLALVPCDAVTQDVDLRLRPPSLEAGGTCVHPFGTDHVGRDVLARLIAGGRVSLAIAALAVLVAGVAGMILGTVAGYRGGALDAVVMHLVNVTLAFPFVLLALATIAVLGPGLRNLVIVLVLTGWPLYTRVIRAETLRLRHTEFVEAARAMGNSTPRILLRHVLPHLATAATVLASLEIPRLIILEAFLSFLGLGVQPPTPSWGAMLGESRQYILSHWWLLAWPAIMIFVTALAMNVLGDALTDRLDPRHVR
jgi:ABC-type dipeptide/oligopeptide/nickel transport system permease subunit